MQPDPALIFVSDDFETSVDSILDSFGLKDQELYTASFKYCKESNRLFELRRLGLSILKIPLSLESVQLSLR